MASLELQITSLRDFVLEEVASSGTVEVDLERFKRQMENYLNELRRTVQADLETISESCCPSSP